MEPNKSPLFIKTLKEQVYEYLKDQIQKGELRPGCSINMDHISQQLGISRTPLRDALLKLEMEGFVIIYPRKGIKVNHLTLDHIRDYYQVIGALEATALLNIIDKIDNEFINFMQFNNDLMKSAIEKADFDLFYRHNLKFHNNHIHQSCNYELIKIINTKRRRLYDFQRKNGIFREWEVSSIKEHQEIINLLKDQKYINAAQYLRDVHWSYNVQEKYIKKYYKLQK